MSGFAFAPEFEDDDDSENNDSPWQTVGRDATVFLIDVAPDMFFHDDDSEDSYFTKSLKCVHATISRKIIANDQDLYSIVFCNSDKSKNSVDFPNIYVLQDLDRPGSERILEIEKLLEDINNVEFLKEYGSTSNTSIHDILWVCRNMIIGCKSKLATKNVLFFTRKDNPHEKDDHKQRQALKGAKDLKEADIDLEVLPLGTNFNMKHFYKDLLTQGEDGDSESLSTLADPTSRFEELLERVRKFDHKQRSCGRILFTIAPGVEMGIKIYTSIRKATKPSKQKLYKVTNEEVITQKKEYLENGELLMPSDFVKYHTFGGKKIRFNLEEVRTTSKVFDTGIQILGFKKISTFTHDLYIKPSNFIYPDEDSVKGSKMLFACLLERCLARDVCPVVRVQSRTGASVSWGFLLPQKEVKDDKGCQDKPPGFHICYLPFADDFRSIELENRTRANSDQVDSAKEVIKKLNFNYHPDSFENPDIQTHWRNIETLALNRAYLEPVKDYSEPDLTRIKKKAGKLIEAFKSLVLPPSYDPVAVSKKRPTPSNVPAAKKAKPCLQALSVEEMANKKIVDKLNMDQLKQWLTSKGVRVTSKKKGQLVQDVYDELNIEV